MSLSHQLRWCILREGSGEVDLLVDPRDHRRAEAALRASGCLPLPTWGRGSHRFLLRYDPASDRWTKLDIVTELAFGPYQELRTGAAALECLERRRVCGDRAYLDPDDAFWALLLHHALDRPRRSGSQSPEPQRHRLAALAPYATTEGPLARWVAGACPPAEIIAWAQAGDWEVLDTLGARVRAGLPAGRRLAARGRAARNRVVRNILRPLARLRRRPLTVALLAPDGAGKSTLQRRVAAAWPLPTWTAYLGLYPQPSTARARRPFRGLAPALRLARFWSSYAAGRWWQACGRLVIYDRHPIDALVLSDAPPDGRRRLRRWVIAHACPLPDLVVVLDAPPPVLYARKAEHSLEELGDQRARYLAYASRHSPDVVVIDASGDPDTVRRTLIQTIWDRWSAARLAGLRPPQPAEP